MSLTPTRIQGTSSSEVLSVQNSGLLSQDIIQDGIIRNTAFHVGNLQWNVADGEEKEYMIRPASAGWIFLRVKGTADFSVKLYDSSMNNIEEEKNHLVPVSLNRASGGRTSSRVYENVRVRQGGGARGKWLDGDLCDDGNPYIFALYSGANDAFYMRIQARGAAAHLAVGVTFVGD